MTRLTILTPTKIAGIARTAATAPVIRPVASARVLERAVPTASISYTPLEENRVKANRLDTPRVEQGNQGTEHRTTSESRSNHRNSFGHMRLIRPIVRRIRAWTPRNVTNIPTTAHTASAVTVLRPSRLREHQRREQEQQQRHDDQEDGPLIAFYRHGGRPG